MDFLIMSTKLNKALLKGLPDAMEEKNKKIQEEQEKINHDIEIQYRVWWNNMNLDLANKLYEVIKLTGNNRDSIFKALTMYEGGDPKYDVQHLFKNPKSKKKKFKYPTQLVCPVCKDLVKFKKDESKDYLMRSDCHKEWKNETNSM